MLLLGTRRAVLVTGEDGLGEVTLAGRTFVTIAQDAGLRELTWTPGDFGLSPQSLAALEVSNAGDSAALIRHVLAGNPGPAREMVLLNAAAALWTAGEDAATSDCTRLAADAIDSGAASRMLARLVEVSNA
jgi:anthranilate phosphoribosyltransferase